jgi:hypothetical protein
MTPYRTPDVRSRLEAGDEIVPVDGDLAVPLLLLWTVSVVRVVGAFVRHQTFGGEVTVAMLLGAAIPWLLRDAVRAYGLRILRAGQRRCCRRRGSTEVSPRAKGPCLPRHSG